MFDWQRYSKDTKPRNGSEFLVLMEDGCIDHFSLTTEGELWNMNSLTRPQPNLLDTHCHSWSYIDFPKEFKK